MARRIIRRRSVLGEDDDGGEMNNQIATGGYATKSGKRAVVASRMPNGCWAGYVEECSLPTGWTETGENISKMTDYDLLLNCPHCGVPLTGMNSRPEECGHRPCGNCGRAKMHHFKGDGCAESEKL
jgi:hypothetical protein